jgi:hypothetical protein
VSFGRPRPFLLDNFQITHPHRDAKFFERKLLRKKVAPFWSFLSIEMHKFPALPSFYEDIQYPSGTRYLHVTGLFFSCRYAQLIERCLRKELRFRGQPSGKNLVYLRGINESQCAVSLHIRRGDFTRQWGDVNALPMTYYTRAIATIRDIHTNPTFFVFSDDIAFARENLPGSDSFVFIDHNDDLSAVEDLRLMSACRHHIIANSTFSWWGAWLNPNCDKDVLVPDPWWETMESGADLIPPPWRKISTRP